MFERVNNLPSEPLSLLVSAQTSLPASSHGWIPGTPVKRETHLQDFDLKLAEHYWFHTGKHSQLMLYVPSFLCYAIPRLREGTSLQLFQGTLQPQAEKQNFSILVEDDLPRGLWVKHTQSCHSNEARNHMFSGWEQHLWRNYDKKSFPPLFCGKTSA